jgi:uncharacterized lipoprotein YddW (UPF0748 family)
VKSVRYYSLFFTLCVVCAVPLSSSGTTYLETLREQTPILPNQELRAAWVVRYALTSQEEIDRAIDYAIRARFQLLFVQVRGRGDAYYRSSLEPAASDLEQSVETFDPLAYLLTRAHDAGIAVHAWVNVCYVWSDPEHRPPADHMATSHPEWLMADADGTRMDEVSIEDWKRRGLEGYFVSPGNPDVRRHTVAVIEDVANRYPVDGIHLDYIRYPGLGFDFSESTRAEFELHFGVDPFELHRDPEAVTALLGDDIFDLVDSLRIEWRIGQVDSLVRMVKGVIGNLPLSAAVVPEYSQARFEKGQDWVSWVVRGDVDFVVPMAYTYEPAQVAELVRLVKRTIGAERFLIGLPVFDGRSHYLGYSVSLLRQQGILGYALFSYNALVEQPFTLEFLERVFLQAFEPADSSSVDSLQTE